MSPPPHHSRTDLADLKSQIARKLGSERAQRYFVLLNRLLCQKLSKLEFDKLCFTTIGQENIPLHNQLIRSILRNAHQSRTPPSTVHDRNLQKPEISNLKKSISLNEVSQQSQVNAQIHPAWSNGDILPPSPRKSRSTNRRTKDRPSPLGTNGKTECIGRPPLPSDEAYIRENGHVKKPAHHLHLELPAKIHRASKPSPRDRSSVQNTGSIGAVSEETEYMQYDRGPIKAPLGIPFCPVSVGAARHLPPLFPCSNSAGGELGGELCHTEALRKRMEQIAEAQGLGGVSMDCADLLNNGLDAYLKRLIKSCVDLAGSRSGNEATATTATTTSVHKQQGSMRSPTGAWQGNPTGAHNMAGSLEGGNEGRSEKLVSLLDFRVAMELKPQQLGEDWPLLLEKVCNRSFEE
ncbi:transcriptional regulator of RNA polII, SAGA, subunit [Wolffia australiana]